MATQTDTRPASPPPSREDYAETRRRIQEFRNKPTPPPKEDKKIFVFDESKPITKGPPQ